MTPRGFDRYMLVVGAGRNRKFARLTDSERCAHVFGILSIAAQSPVRGYLLVSESHEAGPEEIACEAGGGVTVRVATSAVEKLKRVGVLVRDDSVGAWFVHDWWDVNPDPRTDPGAAERMRRYRRRRQRDASDGSQSVTDAVTLHASLRNGDVTQASRGDDVTHPEVEGEEEALLRDVPSPQSNAVASDEANPADIRLCALLRARATDRNPKFKVKSRSRWLTDMRLLRERDGNSEADIERAIEWVFRDSFWGGVIQSPGNLREHFAAIWDRMHKGQVVPLRGQMSELDQRRLEAAKRLMGQGGAA